MSSSLEGKVILITGGAVRIGAAIAKALAQERVHIVVHYRRSKDEAAKLCGQLAERGVKAAAIQSDLASEGDCSALVADAMASFGRLDVLINNAAVFHKGGLSTLTADSLLREFWTNLHVPMLLTRAFTQSVDSGKIVNLLDRRVTALDTATMAYSLTKKALSEFTRMAALELAPAFTVNGVAPGAILPPPGEDDTYLRTHAGPIPLECACSTEDVAQAVVYLLKTDALTGQTIFVDGGQHLLA